MVLPPELTRLALVEKLYLENNKLSFLPPELGDLSNLKVLRLDYNFLVSVPDHQMVLKDVEDSFIVVWWWPIFGDVWWTGGGNGAIEVRYGATKSTQ
ncbi:hypothetical protein ACHQM5_021431 [Ranunculus cassubicifolius]